MLSPPDCLICGACCASPFLGEGYIPVDAAEQARLKRRGLPVLELISDPENPVDMLGTKINAQGARVCVALSGRLGKQVACTIYADRPALCRQFEAGSRECLAARRAVGLG